ncbi:MAG: response regulator transcription factor [Thermoflexales bacterium]|nr:response regulator transcription factor [Thermoflexales bacterium]
MSMKQRVRVLIVDDHVHTRHALQALLAVWPEIEVVGAVEHSAQLIHWVEECRPDVVLVVGISTPGLAQGQGHERSGWSAEEMDGLEALRLIKNHWPQVRIVVLAMYATHRAAALAAGAEAFLLKGCPAQDLQDAILETG